MNTQTNILQSALDTLLATQGDSIENAAICEFSCEDSTPTLHVHVWRNHEFHVPANLHIAAQGHSDVGPVFCLQTAEVAE